MSLNLYSAKGRIETPAGMTGAEYLSLLAKSLVKYGKVFQLEPHGWYTAWCDHCLEANYCVDGSKLPQGLTAFDAVSAMAALGWSVVPVGLNVAPRLLCRNCAKG